MKSPAPSQNPFLRSAIAHALETEPERAQFTVLNNGIETANFRHTEESDPIYLLFKKGTSEPVRFSASELPDAILSELQESGDSLIIASGEKAVRFAIKGTSVTRETLEDHQSILKNPLWAVGKATHLDPGQAAPLLKTIELMTAEGEIKAAMRKKFKQVNHFLDLLSPQFQNESKGTFTIVDCGCGKSYLGFVLFWFMQRVLNRASRFIGIDTSEPLIGQCRERADRLGLRDMSFQCTSIREANLPKRIDLLVSLHACDTATDEAIACGVARKVKQMAIVPCCQHELADQIETPPMYPLAKHGIFKHRFADLLTDMARSLFLEANGYTVTAGEFVSPEETPKNLILRAAWGNPLAKQRAREYEAFKAHYTISPSLDRFLHEREDK